MFFVPLDVSMAEEQEEVVQQRKTEEEEMDREALQQEEVVDVEEPHQTTKERPDEEGPIGRTEDEGEQDQEEDPPSGR